MKKQLLYTSIISLLFGVTGIARATLLTIGTATYNDGSNTADYNLIWDDNNNGNSVIWLDYSNERTNWSAQNSWAAGLDGQLIYNFNAMYNVTWDATTWHLGNTVDETFQWGNDGTTSAGYNISTSEMGHLFFEELNNPGYYDTSGTGPQSGWGLQNTGDFEPLIAASYWSSTEYSLARNQAWVFNMEFGSQAIDRQYRSGYGLALRNGQVSTAAPVPEPSTILLFGAGLAGLATLRKHKKSYT